MRSIIKISSMLIIGAISYSVYAADAVVATVNGQAVKQSWIDVIQQDTKNQGRMANDNEILSLLIRNQLLAQEAIRRGVEKRPEFITRQEIEHNELLARTIINDTVNSKPITDDMLKAEYENFKTRMGDKEYSIRHIQVKTEAEAKDIIAQLAKDVDFAKLAKEKSLDIRSKDNGGSIPWVTKNVIAPALANAAEKLQKGLFTTVPIQTRMGWHILKLDDVRDAKAPAFDKVKESLRRNIKQKQISELVNTLQTKSKIQINK